MPKKNEPNFTLPAIDDLFSTQEMRDDAKLSKVKVIELSNGKIEI